MASESKFQRFLVALRGESDRLLVLVEDSDVDAGWRIVTETDLAEIWQSLESDAPEGNSEPGRLCYNLEEAAQAVGVSVHKFNSWIHRAQAPVPHFRDGRRILIPIALLEAWLSAEVARHMPE